MKMSPSSVTVLVVVMLTVCTKARSQCREALANQTQMMADMKMDLNTLKADMAAQQEVLEQRQTKMAACMSRRVAFMARVSPRVVALNGPVVFDKLIYSGADGAYDHTTGRFTCQEPGLYQFTVHALSKHKTVLALALMLNSEQLSSMFANNRDTVDTDTINAVVHLNTNDVVNVVVVYVKAQLFEDVNTRQQNVFMGHMIQGDDCLA